MGGDHVGAVALAAAAERAVGPLARDPVGGEDERLPEGQSLRDVPVMAYACWIADP